MEDEKKNVQLAFSVLNQLTDRTNLGLSPKEGSAVCNACQVLQEAIAKRDAQIEELTKPKPAPAVVASN